MGNRIQWILLRRGLVADETTLTTKCIGVFYCHFAVMKTILGTRIITVPDKGECTNQFISHVSEFISPRSDYNVQMPHGDCQGASRNAHQVVQAH